MSEPRLFPDEPRETLRREAMELAAALITQIVLVLQMPGPPRAAALKVLLRGALAHAEAIARRLVWMLAALLAARQPKHAAAPARKARPSPAANLPAAKTGQSRSADRLGNFRLIEPCRQAKAILRPLAPPAPASPTQAAPIHAAPARPRPAPDAARLLKDLTGRLQLLVSVLNDPEKQARRLLRQRARLASTGKGLIAPAIQGFAPRQPQWQRTLDHLCTEALAARQHLINTS